MSIISDHALLRYLERACKINMNTIRMRAVRMGCYADSDSFLLAFLKSQMGIDVDGVRRRLAASPEIQKAIASGASAVRLKGITFRIRNGTVVTTIGRDERARMRPKLRRNQYRALRQQKETSDEMVDA
jgi:hypothetical protein